MYVQFTSCVHGIIQEKQLSENITWLDSEHAFGILHLYLPGVFVLNVLDLWHVWKLKHATEFFLM